MLDELSKQIKNPNLPPVSQWQPELSGDIDIVIDYHGCWFYQEGEIKRKALVKLFSGILRAELNHVNQLEHYLVTPVEKWRIQVQATPLIAVHVDVVNSGSIDNKIPQQIILTDNMGYSSVLTKKSKLSIPLELDSNSYAKLIMRDNLYARLETSVYYQLANYIEEKPEDPKLEEDSQQNKAAQYFLRSNNEIIELK